MVLAANIVCINYLNPLNISSSTKSFQSAYLQGILLEYKYKWVDYRICQLCIWFWEDTCCSKWCFWYFSVNIWREWKTYILLIKTIHNFLHKQARSAVGVQSLPLGVPVEIEAIAEILPSIVS